MNHVLLVVNCEGEEEEEDSSLADYNKQFRTAFKK